ncbi:MAG: DNA primase [Elusimicrobiota bacterium]
MGFIPPESLDAVRSHLDIADLAAQYVTDLKPSGKNFKGRCPFHQERTPSFYVNPERQTFHCFGCGVGGDAFAFLMRIENLGFSEAVERLAERAGVAISWNHSSDGPGAQERRGMLDALSFAADFYGGCLESSPRATRGRDYLAGRGVTNDSIRNFKIGYAPGSGELCAAAAKKGLDADILFKSGLASPGAKGERPRDYFFDRIVFPIRDAKGAVIGFGARTLGEGEPKYLNSPESAVFSKGRVLYGLFEGLTSIRKTRKAVLMEGYMDVVAAHQHGFPIACAPLGTALTPDQAGLLKRYAGAVAVVFDSDKAGEAATVRAAGILLSSGLSVRAAAVSSGKDPDEFLRARGALAFKDECLAKSEDPPAFLTKKLLARASKPLSPEAKSALAREVLTLIAKTPDEILKSEWIKRLARELAVPEGALSMEMGRGKFASRAPDGAAQKPIQAAMVAGEDERLLSLVFQEPQEASCAGEDDFSSPSAKKIWRAFWAAREKPSWPADLLAALDEPEKSCASALLVGDGRISREPREFSAAISRGRALKRIRELEPLIRDMGAGKRPKDAALQEEYLRLSMQTKERRD